MKRPAFQFYPGDWLEDVGLRMCSLAARGLWADMLCFMHQGEPYGHLRKNGRDIGVDDLARMVGTSKGAVRRLLHELEERHVFSRTDAGTVYSRRQVRDEALRTVRAEGGPEGGAKAFDNPNASRPGEPRKGGRKGVDKGVPDAPLAPPPSSPSPSPSPSARTDGRQTAPENPLVTNRPGGRPGLESEGWALVREINALDPDRDPADIVAEASGYKGAERTKLNLNTMSDDRLLNTVRDLKHMLENAKKRANSPQGEPSQYERLQALRAERGGHQ